ncbi:MAG: hypothetical protein M3P28_08425 [Thermoproteota archaeon]|nr:hypothetical protein [Thermoproteota archaeon]
MTSNLIIVATLVTALYLNPSLIGSSFSTTGPSDGVDESITAMLEDAMENQTSAPENENDSSGQENNQEGNFCLKGTGPGTNNPCIPCTPTTSSSPGESECGVLPEGETISNESKLPSSDPQIAPNNPKLPSSLSNWFSAGIQELETDKTIPSGTGKALQSFQQSNPSEMLKICKAISKDPSADIKLADCNALQGGGEKAEELRWIIAGWTAGKLIESAEANSTSADTP